MADRFYYGEFGAHKQDITEAATDDATKDVSVRITYDATANGKLEALKVLDAIRARMIEDTWPPA